MSSACPKSARPASSRVLVLLGIVVLAAGCGGGGETAGGSGGGAHAGPAMAAGGPGARPELPPVAVAVAEVGRGAIASYYQATSTLEPEKQADVLARVSGVVLKLQAEEGARVRQGQPLVTLQDDEFRYRLAQAEAEKVKQQARFERGRKMFEQTLISSEDFETVKTELQAAEATADLAALELSYTQVRAPFDGRIVLRQVDPGQTVSNGTVLFTVADLDPLLARVHVPAREFRSIRTEQPVELRVDSAPEPLRGKITLVSPIVDPANGTIKVTVEVGAYPEGVRPGDFAEVRIVTERHENTLLVPRTAVLTDKGERVVFVAAADTTAERRVVEVGFENDRETEILAGLQDGESVVIQGQRSLKQGQPLRLLPPMRFDEAPADSAGAEESAEASIEGPAAGTAAAAARPAGKRGHRGRRG